MPGGLGNTTWLLDLGDGRALVVDPPRGLRAVRAAAHRRGLQIAYAADTHLHADFLTGVVQLAATDGATILASAAGQRVFAHRGWVVASHVEDVSSLSIFGWIDVSRRPERQAC
jgi:glyoxylase-like metal-dependent hydrolase (beta-lactamase superfamily II)